MLLQPIQTPQTPSDPLRASGTLVYRSRKEVCPRGSAIDNTQGEPNLTIISAGLGENVEKCVGSPAVFS